MTETPTLNDIDTHRTREIGETIRDLKEGDTVRATNNRMDDYVEGEVIETSTDPNGGDYYAAIIQCGEQKAELHVNWRDIPADADDQETPYTGLLLEPFNDTAPAVTDIEVVDEE